MPTPIISFASTKGGAGKTTLAFVLATCLANRLNSNTEYQVACIDCDPNKALYSALRKFGCSKINPLLSNAENLLPTLRDAQKSAGAVLIDLEGSANQAMLFAAGKSDLVIIPAQPSGFDVSEANKTAAVVRQAVDLVGRDIQIRIVLTRTPVLRQKVADHSRAQFQKKGLPVLDVELVQRTAFQMMTYTGKPPSLFDPKTAAAAANVEALADAIVDVIGLPIGSEAAA